MAKPGPSTEAARKRNGMVTSKKICAERKRVVAEALAEREYVDKIVGSGMEIIPRLVRAGRSPFRNPAIKFNPSKAMIWGDGFTEGI